MKISYNSPLSAYLSQLREHSGLSLEQVAKAAGYAGRSSVQRYFEDEGLEELRPLVARKLAQVFYMKGKPPLEIRDLRRLASFAHDFEKFPDESLAAALGIEMDVQDTSRPPHEASRIGYIPIVGPAHASGWMEERRSIDVPEGWIPALSELRDGQLLYAVRIVGPSVNKVALDGTYAICQPFGEGGHSAPDGKFVHAERNKGGFVEWTIKRTRWSKNGLLLCPYSVDKEHQEPLKFGDSNHDVKILGIVIAWYRPA